VGEPTAGDDGGRGKRDVLIIILFVCSGSKRTSADDAFTLYENNTGWTDSEHFLFVLSLYLTMRRWLGVPLSLYLCNVDVNGM
jgi:hypothetical protein